MVLPGGPGGRVGHSRTFFREGRPQGAAFLIYPRRHRWRARRASLRARLQESLARGGRIRPLVEARRVPARAGPRPRASPGLAAALRASPRPGVRPQGSLVRGAPPRPGSRTPAALPPPGSRTPAARRRASPDRRVRRRASRGRTRLRPESRTPTAVPAAGSDRRWSPRGSPPPVARPRANHVRAGRPREARERAARGMATSLQAGLGPRAARGMATSPPRGPDLPAEPVLAMEGPSGPPRAARGMATSPRAPARPGVPGRAAALARGERAASVAPARSRRGAGRPGLIPAAGKTAAGRPGRRRRAFAAQVRRRVRTGGLVGRIRAELHAGLLWAPARGAAARAMRVTTPTTAAVVCAPSVTRGHRSTTP